MDGHALVNAAAPIPLPVEAPRGNRRASCKCGYGADGSKTLSKVVVHVRVAAPLPSPEDNVTRLRALLEQATIVAAAAAAKVNLRMFGKWMQQMGIDTGICRLGLKVRHTFLRRLAEPTTHPLHGAARSIGLLA